jgi:hypothetical protein
MKYYHTIKQTYYNILYHTISYYIILYHTISYYITLHHTISYYIILTYYTTLYTIHFTDDGQPGAQDIRGPGPIHIPHAQVGHTRLG